MESFFLYIKPVIFFLILESVVFSLISDGTFKKLAKLFCGVVLIMLILVPVGKFMGITEVPGDFLKSAQLEQSMQQCEDMINYGDEYLINRYTKEYENIMIENISSIVENEGMELENCDITMETDGEVKIKKIVLRISKEGQEKQQEELIDVNVDVGISINDDDRKVMEEPEIIKIRNTILDTFHLEEENILITKA